MCACEHRILRPAEGVHGSYADLSVSIRSKAYEHRQVAPTASGEILGPRGKVSGLMGRQGEGLRAKEGQHRKTLRWDWC